MIETQAASIEIWPRTVVAAFTLPDDWYASLASLLRDGFPTVETAVITSLDGAAHAMARSIIVADKIIDEEPGDDGYPALMEAVLGFQFLAYETLRTLFSTDSPFWDDFRRYATSSASATTVFPASPETKDQLLARMRDRNALHCGIFAALCTIAGSRDRLADLEEAMRSFCIALQIVDDIHDWKSDFERGRRTTATLAANSGEGLLSRGVAEDLLDESVQHLRAAQRTAANYHLARWGAFINGRICAFGDLRDRLRHARQRAMGWGKRVSSVRAFQADDLALVGNGANESAIAEIGTSLFRAWHHGFGELKHLMDFPREGGFGGRLTLKSGDLFARLLVMDALRCLPLADAGARYLRSVTEIETEYLVSLGERDPLGHRVWKYFPDFPELPPDLDDLAELMRFASRLPNNPFDGDIRTALAHLSRDADTGAFETWIVPPHSDHPEHERQRQYIASSWGRGCDVEVLANFLDASASYGFVIGQVDRDASMALLAREQAADGLWASTWYVGPFYGTFAALRALRHFPNDSTKTVITERAIRGLQETATPQGTWGMGMGEDRLSTALALLALREVGINGISHAARELLCDCGHPSVPFIKMEIPQHNASVRTVTYGSRTLTNAYAMRALLEARFC